MKKYIFIYLFIAPFFFGCEDWLDVNKDPNNLTSLTPDLMLPVAQNYTARWYNSDRFVQHLGNMIMYNWSESGGYSWYNDEFLYLVNSTFYNEIFEIGYYRALKDYQQMDILDPEVYPAYVGIAKIMKAYHFQILVDFYGDIPYSDALKRSEVPNPTYDDAESIYDDLLVQLTGAIALLEAAEDSDLSIDPVFDSNPNPSANTSDDRVFHGDLTKWKQFANTIKLRILTRVSDVKSTQFISDALAVISAEGSGYITDDVEINLGYVKETNKQNPYWEYFGANANGVVTLTSKATCASDFILDYLQDRGDTRIDFIFEKPATGHLGVPQGITADPVIYHSDNVSGIGPGILSGDDQSSIILTLAETYFNQAELALKGFGGDPETFYNMGVTASFETLGATGASNYLAQNIENVNYAFSSNKLEAIITQKWLAGIGLTAEQSWFDHSRTGYPVGLPISQEAPNLRRPVRLAYPASEVSGNSANMPSQPDVFTSKVFWAK